MITNRKRVAKRLVSGLLAGAVALGGLAISGGTVSAKTPTSPTTNRLAGDDRYETAVALARDINSVSDGLVIASGESPWDALSAAPLTNADRPMLLVKSDSVPESVSDFISDYKSNLIGGGDKIYVVGGTSVISTDVADAILAAAKTVGDTNPPKIVRVAGEDRYATSKAVSAIVAGAADTMILVNGTSWADAVSAGAMAAENGWPLVLTPGAYSGSAAEAIDAYLALPGSSAQVLIVGGPAVMPTSIDEALIVDGGLAPADITRIGGADRYQTSLLVNVYLYNYDNDFDGENVALVSGENYPDALAAAGWAAVSGGAGNRVHVQLTTKAGGNVMVSTLSGTLAAIAKAATVTSGKNSNLWIIGGKAAVADTAKAGYIAASNTDLTTTLVCPSEGAQSLTIVWSGALSSTAVVGEQARVTYAILAPKIKKNGVAMAAGDFALAPVKVSDSTYALILGTAAAEDDEFTLASDVEGSNFTVISRTAVGSSCTVAADTDAPNVSLRAVAGPNGDGSAAADQYYVLTSNEPLDLSGLVAADWTIDSATPSANPSCVAVNSASTSFLCNLDASEATVAATAAGDVVTIAAANILDLAGNAVAADLAATVVADSTAPALSVSSVTCVANGAASWSRNDLDVTDSGDRGANGNMYTMSVVNQRGLLIPSVSIDDTAKTITVTMDTGYHTAADVVKVAENSGLADPLLGTWTFADNGGGNGVSATVTPVISATGSSDCTLKVASNEPAGENSAAITINGYSAVVTALTNADAGAVAGSADAKYLSHTFTFTTSMMGNGLLTFTAGANGMKDGKGNDVLSGLTFTVS